jgi:DNA-binding CsgD family transcriptional regulator
MELTESSKKKLTSEFRLSRRELQIICILLEGVEDTKEIAKRLSMSPWTIKSDLRFIFSKTSSHSRFGLLIKIQEFIGLNSI